MAKKTEHGVDLNRYSARSRKKKHRVGLIVTNVLASLVLVVSLLAMSGMMLLNMRFQDTKTGTGDGDTQAVADMTDVKTSEHEDVTYFLILGTDEKDTLTDVIMVGCFDHGRKTLNILQIPRDTYIGNDIPSGKVNAVYGSAKQGQSNIEFLIKRINDYFGLPIDHYVLVHLSAFRNVVDAVGGVDVDLPNRLLVNDSGSRTEYYIGPGLTHLDGCQAEGFVRNRSGKGYGTGDMARVEAQRLFYAAFAQKVKGMGMGSVVSIVTSCYDQFKTDLSVGQMLGYAQEIKQLDMANVRICAVPGQGGYFTPGRQRLSYYSIHKQDYVDLVNELFLPYNDPISAADIKVTELHTQKSQPWIKEGQSFEELTPQSGDDAD